MAQFQNPSVFPLSQGVDSGFSRWDLQVVTAQWTVLKDWDFADLRAPYWRLYWNPARGAKISTGGESMEILPEYFYLIPPETSYASTVSRATDHFYAHFLTSHHWTLPGIQATPVQHTEADFLNSLRSKPHDDSIGWNVIAFLALAIARLPGSGWAVGSVNDQRIAKAQRTIEGRVPESVSPYELAIEAGMNVNAFIRLFRQKVGLTPAKYAMARRIEIACMLLHHSGRTIDDIAESCGFCDRHHFTRCFSKNRGISPAAFRQQSKPAGELVACE